MPASTLESRERSRLTEDGWLPANTTATFSVYGTISGEAFTERQVSYPFREGKIVVTLAGVQPAWLDSTAKALADLLDLSRNWDTYGAPRVRPENVDTALDFAFSFFRVDTPAPSVVPTSKGGVQFEWHRNGIDLEIEFPDSVTISAAYENAMTGELWERDLAFDPKPFLDVVMLLSRRR